MESSDERPKIALGSLEWGVIISLFVSGASAIFSAGVVYSTVREHESRIVKVEARSEGVSERLASIESKLEFLVEQYRNEKKGN
jgi:hypothetical protein